MLTLWSLCQHHCKYYNNIHLKIIRRGGSDWYWYFDPRTWGNRHFTCPEIETEVTVLKMEPMVCFFNKLRPSWVLTTIFVLWFFGLMWDGLRPWVGQAAWQKMCCQYEEQALEQNRRQPLSQTQQTQAHCKLKTYFSFVVLICSCSSSLWAKRRGSTSSFCKMVQYLKGAMEIKWCPIFRCFYQLKANLICHGTPPQASDPRGWAPASGCSFVTLCPCPIFKALENEKYWESAVEYRRENLTPHPPPKTTQYLLLTKTLQVLGRLVKHPKLFWAFKENFIAYIWVLDGTIIAQTIFRRPVKLCERNSYLLCKFWSGQGI